MENPADSGPPEAGLDSRLARRVREAVEWLSLHRKTRIIVATIALALAVVPSVVLVIFPDLIEGFEGLGYLGVFVANAVSTATLFIPVPGVTAAANLLIVSEGEHRALPWLVGILGGVGMAAGEITAYSAGYFGAEIMRGRDLPGPRRFHRVIRATITFVSTLMQRWGMPTLFVLSVLPNPLFEFAGVTAGSTRMSVWRFFLAVGSGTILRGVLLAYLGEQIPLI